MLLFLGLFWHTLHTFVCLPSHQLYGYSSWLFGGDADCYCPLTHVPFGHGQVLCQKTCTASLLVSCDSDWQILCYILLLTLLLLTFILQLCVSFHRSSEVQQCAVSLWFPLPHMVISRCYLSLGLYVQGSGLPLSFF